MKNCFRLQSILNCSSLSSLSQLHMDFPKTSCTCDFNLQFHRQRWKTCMGLISSYIVWIQVFGEIPYIFLLVILFLQWMRDLISWFYLLSPSPSPQRRWINQSSLLCFQSLLSFSFIFHPVLFQIFTISIIPYLVTQSPISSLILCSHGLQSYLSKKYPLIQVLFIHV